MEDFEMILFNFHDLYIRNYPKNSSPAPWASLRGGHPMYDWLDHLELITLYFQATHIGLWLEMTPTFMTLLTLLV